MIEDRDPGKLAVDPPADVAPPGPSAVAVAAVLAFRG
jgi:hypothetical protein